MLPPYGYGPLDGIAPRTVAGMQVRAIGRAVEALQEASRFDVTDIPPVMDKLNWTVGAALMRRWFGRPARTMSAAEKDGSFDPRNLPPEAIDETTVTMDWALRFGRVQDARDELLDDWNSPAAQRVLTGRLRDWIRTKGLQQAQEFRFGDLRAPAKVLDRTCQANLKPVNDSLVDRLTDPLDDLYAALGRASLKLAVQGLVTRSVNSGEYILRVDALGIYVRDTYDFNGDQPLGHWSRSGASKIGWPGTTEITNADFRRHRNRTGRGGDFVIFSDVRRVHTDTKVILLRP